MPTYAPVPAFAQRTRYPRALVVIVALHAAAISAVMLVKMDLPGRVLDPPTQVELIPLPKEPPPNPPEPSKARPAQSTLDQPVAIVPVQIPMGSAVDSTPTPFPNPGPVIGILPHPGPAIIEPKPAPVRTGPRFATPDSRLRPPYPPAKLSSGEEAALRLRLTIDEGGRVTAVDPVESADPAFLKAARRHLIANWRYQPATEDGRPVASSTVVTLHFRLDD